MQASASHPEQPLLGRIDEAQEKLGGLEQNLHAIDGELGRLSAQREQYELLAQTCDSLEQLGALGAAELFWGDDVDRSQAARHVRELRERVDEFLGHIANIEERRQEVVDEIAQGREVLAILEDDLDELREEEEERRHEWVVEREADPLPERPTRMPWTQGGEEDRRFRKSLGWSLAAALLFGLLLPLIHLPAPEPSEVIEVPERLVRLITQERQLPEPPPQQVAQEQEEPPPETEPEPEPTPEPEPEPEPVVAEQPPEPAPEAPAPQQEAPRKRAESSGILAFRESFSSLAADRPSAKLGSEARINNAGDTAVGRPERAMVTTQAPGSSGGINLASLSRDVGGGEGGGPQIAGVQTGRVTSSIGPGGGDGRPLAGSGAAAGRTDEEIQIVFDRYKASLYRLYNRELRKDPTLRGQIVLRLTIEPDGSVSMCELQSTDMNAPELAQQVVDRVRTFDFGAKDVAPVTISYPIDFLPAA